MPDTGVLRLLTSEQRATGWRRQLEVEKSLGLEKGAISNYFLQLAQAHKSKSTSAARRELRKAGVYRVEGLRRGKHRPPRNWWIAFAGKGNPRPVLHLSRESHPFAPERVPGEEGDSLAGVAEPSEGGHDSPSTTVPETSEGGTGGYRTAILGRGDCVQDSTSSTAVPETSEVIASELCTAAPERSECDRSGTSQDLEERIEGVRGTSSTAAPDLEDTVDGVNIKCMRSRWLREPALQAMMSSCTWDYFSTSDELGKFLCINEDDLKPILPRVRSSAGDDTFLSTCGIRSRRFNKKKRYCLLGCGNLIILGPKLCAELLACEPQPLYWGMAPWGVDASTNVMAGFESLDTMKTMVDLSKAIQASLLCKRCTSRIEARWSFMRRESKARMILSRGAPCELGLKFEFDVCGCIHLGESLPDTAVRGLERISLSNATEVILRTLPSLYQPEFDGVPKVGVTTVGRISQHGAIRNSSRVTHPLAGSTGNSTAERGNPACPSPKTPTAGTCVTPTAPTQQAESPRSVVLLHPLATATHTPRTTTSEGGVGFKGSGSEDGLRKAVRRRSLVGPYLGRKGEANCRVPAGASVFSAEDTSAGNIQRRKIRVATLQKCAATAAALKVTNKLGEGQHLDAASDNHGRGEKYAQSKASVEMPLYDRAGSNHRRSEGEVTMHLNTPSQRKQVRPGAAKASPSSRCRFCEKRGVSSDFLATQRHYKRGKTETCEAVQRAWFADGSRSSPGAESETAPEEGLFTVLIKSRFCRDF